MKLYDDNGVELPLEITYRRGRTYDIGEIISQLRYNEKPVTENNIYELVEEYACEDFRCDSDEMTRTYIFDDREETE